MFDIVVLDETRGVEFVFSDTELIAAGFTAAIGPVGIEGTDAEGTDAGDTDTEGTDAEDTDDLTAGPGGTAADNPEPIDRATIRSIESRFAGGTLISVSLLLCPPDRWAGSVTLARS